MKISLGLAILAMALALASPGVAGQQCAVDLSFSGAPKLEAKGTGKYTDFFRSFPIFNAPKADVEGSVRLVFPAVDGGCAFQSPFTITPANLPQLNSALGNAQLSTPQPFNIGNIAGVYGTAGVTAYFVEWSIQDLKFTVASGPIGGKVNQKKPVPVTATITSGNATVHFMVAPAYYPPSGYEDRFSFPLAGVGSRTSGCSLRLRKTQRDFTLDCSKLTITLDQIDVFLNKPEGIAARKGADGGVITPQGDHVQINLGLKGYGLKSIALLSSAVAAP